MEITNPFSFWDLMTIKMHGASSYFNYMWPLNIDTLPLHSKKITKSISGFFGIQYKTFYKIRIKIDIQRPIPLILDLLRDIGNEIKESSNKSYMDIYTYHFIALEDTLFIKSSKFHWRTLTRPISADHSLKNPPRYRTHATTTCYYMY